MDARITRFACAMIAHRFVLGQRLISSRTFATSLALLLLATTAVRGQAVDRRGQSFRQAPVQQASFQRQGAYRTANFVVSAPTAALAREIGDSAEAWRKSLAIEWIGKPMPNWIEPCPIDAKVSPQLGAGGATTFVFDRGEVFGWEMSVQGTRERVLDSVLPHEITHTVFASYFRKPLPRWADEGACTTVEHRSEIGKQERLLIQFLKTGKGIPFSQLFAMKDYPADILPLYSQGHSLTQFLLERRGKQAFLAFLTDGMRDENWRRAVALHYGHDNLYALQEQWLDWVKSGRPRIELENQIAAVTPVEPAAQPDTRSLARGPSSVARPSIYAKRLDASTEGGTVWR